MKIKTNILYFFLSLFFLASCTQTKNLYRVIDVHDGDTITVVDQDCNAKCQSQNIRLIGLDSPELAQDYWGEQAQKFTENEVLGKTILLNYGIDMKDRYGRILGYVFYDFDLKHPSRSQARLLNQEILKHGLAEIYLFPGEKQFSRELKSAEYEARSKSMNIWNKETGLKESPAKFRARQQKEKKKSN